MGFFKSHNGAYLLLAYFVLNREVKMEYLETISHWKESIEKFIMNDIKKCLDLDIMETGLIILTLSGTECISGYYCGRKADDNTFIEFLNSKFFPEEYNKYSENIYKHLRNGLVHDHTNKNNLFALFRNANDSPHLKTLSTTIGQRIFFNREIFAIDLLNAWEQYSNEIVDNPQLSLNFFKRINYRDRGYLGVHDIYEEDGNDGDMTQCQTPYPGGTI